MRDGVKLATDIHLAQTNGSYPVILVRTPYNKSMIGGLAGESVRRGFALVAQDTRGRYESEGENLPFDRDGPDGQDTLEWLNQQPWCNGKIGTWGGSAGAITQFQLAPGADGLVCQHLTVGAANLLEVVYSGGLFR
jgi:putative CocE/NonD family hydrolase